MIIIKQSGSFKNLEHFLNNVNKIDYLNILNRYGQEGVKRLSFNTPIDSGTTASAWDYEVKLNGKKATINWTNSNIVDGVPIAILIQYGHSTANGSFVQGRDYINPAIRPILDDLADNIWREVTNL